MPTTQMQITQGFLLDPNMAALLVAVLIERLGGKATITQEDIDAVAFRRLEEEFTQEGVLKFTLLDRPGTYHD